MASANVVEIVTMTVDLSLTLDEAKALCGLLHFVGGEPGDERKGWTIRGLLTDAPGNPREALVKAIGPYTIKMGTSGLASPTGAFIPGNSKIIPG